MTQGPKAQELSASIKRSKDAKCTTDHSDHSFHGIPMVYVKRQTSSRKSVLVLPNSYFAKAETR
jgi:hypothetical protein